MKKLRSKSPLVCWASMWLRNIFMLATKPPPELQNIENVCCGCSFTSVIPSNVSMKNQKLPRSLLIKSVVLPV